MICLLPWAKVLPEKNLKSFLKKIRQKKMRVSKKVWDRQYYVGVSIPWMDYANESSLGEDGQIEEWRKGVP